MQCPYCGENARREQPDSGGVLLVTEVVEKHTEPFDTEITLWRCTMYPAHIFYADDYNGNCS